MFSIRAFGTANCCKQPLREMKNESDTLRGAPHVDPVALAAQALARAMADAQHAVSAAHSQASLDRIALAACRKESEVLQAKNATRVASSRTQLQEINFLRMRCDALAADCELAREEISTRDRKIEHFRLQVLVAREEAVIAEQDSLGRERATLSKDRDLVNTDRKSTVRALKRSVEFLQTQIAQQERADSSASNLRESETPEDRGDIGILY
ncbi:hypothetical protein B0H13DRAFT_2302690 [Mycena leptocephala]|nr:hypothetical protein B0H13DRAFT_2302690 [Mycena leptocephala]